MKPDRELLELAALAAGIDGKYDDDMKAFRRLPAHATPYGEAYSYWNPLEDDGDALRLEVALKEQLKFYWSAVQNRWVAEIKGDMFFDSDRKRCSVRAAAALGEAMKEPPK